MASEPENLLCSSCGADIRPGTSFCYKCGESLASSGEAGSVSADGEKAIVSNAWFKEDISVPAETGAPPKDEQDFQKTIPDPGPVSPEENSEPVAAPAAAEETSASDETPAVAEVEAEPEIKPVSIRPKEKPAVTPASTEVLRRKPKLQREKIEMAWEAPEQGSNRLFLIGTGVIFVAVLLILLGVYLMK
jgi:hypothetical protein